MSDAPPRRPPAGPGGGPDGLAGRIARVRAAIARACERSGRPPGSVTLVAVSKTRSIEEIRAAAALGLSHFGENRVQEARAKFAAGLPAGAVLHLVGHLQSNKVRDAARLFAVIHSLDSAELLHRLEERASRPIEAFVQVDLAGEPTKHGAPPEAVAGILAAARDCRRVAVRGLMCLPPAFADPEQVRPYFRRLRALRDGWGGEAGLPWLSMGMSHDFEVAIEEGATHVRIGEALFGPRAGPPGRAGG